MRETDREREREREMRRPHRQQGKMMEARNKLQLRSSCFKPSYVHAHILRVHTSILTHTHTHTHTHTIAHTHTDTLTLEQEAIKAAIEGVANQAGKK